MGAVWIYDGPQPYHSAADRGGTYSTGTHTAPMAWVFSLADPQARSATSPTSNPGPAWSLPPPPPPAPRCSSPAPCSLSRVRCSCVPISLGRQMHRRAPTRQTRAPSLEITFRPTRTPSYPPVTTCITAALTASATQTAVARTSTLLGTTTSPSGLRCVPRALSALTRWTRANRRLNSVVDASSTAMTNARTHHMT